MDVEKLLVDVEVHIKQLSLCKRNTHNSEEIDTTLEQLRRIYTDLTLKGGVGNLVSPTGTTSLPNNTNDFRAAVKLKHLQHSPNQMLQLARDRHVPQPEAKSVVASLNHNESIAKINLWTNYILTEHASRKDGMDIHDVMDNLPEFLMEDDHIREEVKVKVNRALQSRRFI